MTPDEVMAEFRAAGALREGHFVLSSGLHSPRVPAEEPRVHAPRLAAERLCRALAEKITDDRRQRWTSCVSPAVGGNHPGLRDRAAWLHVPAALRRAGRRRAEASACAVASASSPATARRHGRGHRHHRPLLPRVRRRHRAPQGGSVACCRLPSSTARPGSGLRRSKRRRWSRSPPCHGARLSRRRRFRPSSPPSPLTDPRQPDG